MACGHSFCAPCLRSYFQVRVRDKLKNIDYLKYHRRPYNCSEAPVDQNHLNRLLHVLHIHNEPNILDIFQFPCPHCRTLACVPPVESISTNTFISDVQTAIGVVIDKENQADERGVQNFGYFDGLFVS
jgi:hypothetical protein